MGGGIASGSTSSGSQTQANIVRIALLFFRISPVDSCVRIMTGLSHCSRRYHLPTRYVWHIPSSSSPRWSNPYIRLVSIIVYCALAAEFLVRFTRDQPVRRSAPVPGEILRGTTDKRLHRMLQAMITMTIFIVIRYFYPPLFLHATASLMYF